MLVSALLFVWYGEILLQLKEKQLNLTVVITSLWFYVIVRNIFFHFLISLSVNIIVQQILVQFYVVVKK